MKTDHIFYRLFKEFPRSFFEIIGRSATEANAYRFESLEVKQTAFRIDGLFVPIAQTILLPLYFIEVQFYDEPELYLNLFAEIFTYLLKNQPPQDWRAVVIYKKRSLEPTDNQHYRELLNSQRVIRIYLDELSEDAVRTLGIGIVQLVVTPEATAAERARQLLQQATQELAEDAQQARKVVDLIETIVLYKFPEMRREALEAMLGLDDLRQTAFAREMIEEGEQKAKLESVPRLLALGLTVEQVAQGSGLTVEEVQKVIQNQE